MWDLRTPSGWFFTMLGAILIMLGLFSPYERAPLTDSNVNLAGGVAMLAFGGVLLALARKRS
jgi:hypothetical protein